ncbi:MAG: twin-arginine translocase subunit TatB [Proteobacteria bacterium]|jgi:sec-independent protein translocase protein TatB|nr:twin-arginine translocase subunit TatB [Pseudomonadota bacterium]
MFDIGFWELCIIGIVLLLVLGPERMPEVAKQIGYWTTRARRTVNQLRNEMRQELNALPTEQLKKTKQNIESLGKEVTSMSADISKQMSEKIDIEDHKLKPAGSTGKPTKNPAEIKAAKEKKPTKKKQKDTATSKTEKDA